MLQNKVEGFKRVFFCFFLLIAVTIALANLPEPVRKTGENVNKIVKIGPLDIEAVLVKGGTYEMGDIFVVGKDDERPVHIVTISDFYLSVTEITVRQYKKFCKRTNRKMPIQEKYSRDNYPVVFVTWYEAKDFCEWMGGLLPTEAQWEYAARSGGLMLKYPTGSNIDHSLANYSGKDGRDKWKKVSPVAKFTPNTLGIYDLAGNVYEWCLDYYKGNYYSLSLSQNPTGPATSIFRVLRGGSWYHDKECLRTSHRFRYLPVARVSFVGFRVAWDPEKVNILK